MDAVEFLKARGRMCGMYDDCHECPLEFFCNEDYMEQYTKNYIAKIVDTVEKWAKEHPVKTRQSEFLTQWPNARLGATGCLMLCPIDVMGREYVSKNIPGCINNGIRCDQCRRDFWLKEIKEE